MMFTFTIGFFVPLHLQLPMNTFGDILFQYPRVGVQTIGKMILTVKNNDVTIGMGQPFIQKTNAKDDKER